MLGLSTTLLSQGQKAWWQAPAYSAIDNSDGSARFAGFVASFGTNRYAITTLASAAIASASAQAAASTSGASFSDLFTFTRSSAATYLDVNGARQSAAVDIPRFDYTNGRRQLLLEGASTNLCTNSDAITSGWNDDGSTLAMVSGVSRYTEPVGNTRYPRAVVTQSANTSYTIQVEVRSFGADPTEFRLAGWTGTGWVQTGLIVLTSTWQRVTFTFSTGATIGSQQGIGFKSTGAAGSGFEFRRVQVEANTFASSVIPTAGSAVTRAADRCALGGKANALFGRSSSSLVVKGKLARPRIDGDPRIMGASDGGGYTLLNATAGYESVGSWIGPSLSASLGAGSFASGFGLGFAKATNFRAIVGNGGSVTQDTTNTAYVTPILLGRASFVAPGGQSGDGWYDELVIWPFRMTNAALQSKAVAYA